MCYNAITGSAPSFWATTPLQSFPLSPLFVRHTHAQTPTLQPQNPWLSHFLTLDPTSGTISPKTSGTLLLSLPTVALCLGNLAPVRLLSWPIQGRLSLDRERVCAKSHVLLGVSFCLCPFGCCPLSCSALLCLSASLYFLKVIMCAFS